MRAKQGRPAGEGFRTCNVSPKAHGNHIETLLGGYLCVAVALFQWQRDSIAGGGSPSW